jgi:hypothetical protein
MPAGPKVRDFSGWDRNKEADKDIENTAKKHN